ncbi:hypothetical protein JCM8547_000874 [Rhodosporidiobolus lusitaniae]
MSTPSQHYEDHTERTIEPLHAEMVEAIENDVQSNDEKEEELYYLPDQFDIVPDDAVVPRPSAQAPRFCGVLVCSGTEWKAIMRADKMKNGD